MGEWQEWHLGYDDPDSPLSARLQAVHEQLARALDRAPGGPLTLLSLCAGDGRDVLPVLAVHARGSEVTGRLVELDPVLAGRARALAPAGLEVLQADAAVRSSLPERPVDLLLLCGIFGNIGDDDVERTVGAVPLLLAPGGTVMWTRHRGEPDLTPRIRAWFTAAGLVEAAFVTGEVPARWSVGAAIRSGLPDRLFTFSTRPGAPALG